MINKNKVNYWRTKTHCMVRKAVLTMDESVKNNFFKRLLGSDSYRDYENPKAYELRHYDAKHIIDLAVNEPELLSNNHIKYKSRLVKHRDEVMDRINYIGESF